MLFTKIMSFKKPGGFLRPQDEDFVSSTSWKEDKADLDAQKDTAFVYNSQPTLGLAAQRQKLPIHKVKF